MPPRCRPGVHGSAPPAAYGPWPTSSGVWAMPTGTRTSPSRSIVRRFCSLAGTVASRARGPPGGPRLRPPGCTPRCSRVVVGRLLHPFRPAAQHCKPIFSPRGDASSSILGTRPPSAAHLFCALCIEIAALCIEILALCIEMVMLLPSALKSQRCASKLRHSVSTLLHYASKWSCSSILHHNRSGVYRDCATLYRNCCILH